jgi:GH18 family chitinase
MYSRMMDVKRKKRDLQVLLAVGGWNMGPAEFSRIVHDENARREFVSSSVVFLKKRKFDGLDLE